MVSAHTAPFLRSVGALQPWRKKAAAIQAAQGKRFVAMASGQATPGPEASNAFVSTPPSTAASVAGKYGWELSKDKPDFSGDKRVRELPVAAIRRPLQGVRSNDQEKVQALMVSIEEHGLHEPIDVLEVEGQYYGFSGCHRFEAHQRLGKKTILCRIRKANRQALKFHMM